MSNTHSNSNNQEVKHKFDLEDRTFEFGVRVINFTKEILGPVNKNIVDQLIRSSTSIGANYYEANEANSKKDFINKIAIAKKEANETKYWLRLISATSMHKNQALTLFNEAQELTLIFAAIIRNS